MPGGRPTDYTPELAADICRLLTARKEDGSPYALKDVCEELGLPESTVYAWKNRHPEFQELYARARLDRADMMAEDVLRVVDTDSDPASARVKMDARKWYAAKLNPKQWGDKGDDPSNPVHHHHKHEGALEAFTGRIASLHARTGEGGNDGNADR